MALKEIDYDTLAFEIRKRNCEEVVDLWHESIANMLAEGMDDETIMGFLDRQDRNASRRVKSYADKGLTDIHEVLVKCSEDALACRWVLAKEPGRTVFQEKAQFAMLSRNSQTCHDWHDLPTNASDEYIPILNGRKLKSVDFTASATGASGRECQVWVMAKSPKPKAGRRIIRGTI